LRFEAILAEGSVEQLKERKQSRCCGGSNTVGGRHRRRSRLLSANEGKASRERLTLIRLFEELRGLG
jgi:hypothetical protein